MKMLSSEQVNEVLDTDGVEFELLTFRNEDDQTVLAQVTLARDADGGVLGWWPLFDEHPLQVDSFALAYLVRAAS